MSSKGHKRKRSLQDIPVDLTKMQLARQRLASLHEELTGIEETENEMEQIMTHVRALEDILSTSKKLKLGFSSVTRKDLDNLGMRMGVLRFNPSELAARSIDSTHIDSLCDQIIRIYRHVSMRFEAGARLVLDAVLLTVADVIARGKMKTPVAILPEMRLTDSDGVLVSHPVTNFQVYLTGNVDYGLCTYEKEEDRDIVLNQNQSFYHFARNRILLIEAKAKRDEQVLYDFLPEAISQAVALGEGTKENMIRFCLSDGRRWIFCLYVKDGQGNRTSYASAPLEISKFKPGLEGVFKEEVSQIAELVHHWLINDADPIDDPLYSLSTL